METITEAVWYFARMRALSMLHLWNPPDVVIEYLMTGNKNLRAATRAAADAMVSGPDSMGEAMDAAWAAATKSRVLAAAAKAEQASLVS